MLFCPFTSGNHTGHMPPAFGHLVASVSKTACLGALFKRSLFYLMMILKSKSNDAGNFITVYYNCFTLLLLLLNSYSIQ
jgi:hypothetical protein